MNAKPIRAGLAVLAAAVPLLAAQAQPPAKADDHLGFSSGFTFQERSGEALFQGICQGCHMPQGQGAAGAGAYPALAGNARLAARTYPAYMVVNGNKAMPGFGSMLDDAQVSAVVNYVRSHFGNSYPDTLTPAEVKALRPKKPVVEE